MKKILLFIVFLFSLYGSAYALTAEQIDNYWLMFIRNSQEINAVLKTVTASGDMDVATEKIRSLYKQFAEKVTSLYSSMDAQQMKSRLSYHFRNKTPIANLMLYHSRITGVEIKRIKQIQGGEIFVVNLFGNRQVAEDQQRQLQERGYSAQ